MSDVWSKIREFEYVLTGPSTSLLRVSAKAPRRNRPRKRPKLVVDDGLRQHTFEAIQAPPDGHKVLRAAYAVPSIMVGPDCQFWLVHEDGGRTRLPAPEEGVARLMRSERRGAPASANPGPDDVGESGALSAELELARERIRALEARIRELQDVPQPSVRGALERASDAESRIHSAQRRADDADERAREAEASAEAARDTAARATATAKVLQTRTAELERNIGEFDQAIAERDAKIGQLETDLIDVAPALDARTREVARLRSERVSLETEFDQTRDQLRLMTFERDELQRQASGFDEIAVKARERAATIQAAYDKSQATLRDLETWRGELERRLADVTTELGAMKAAREADERELVRLRSAVAEAERRQGDPSQAGNGAETSQTVAQQAAEIEQLSAELAELRARTERGGSSAR